MKYLVKATMNQPNDKIKLRPYFLKGVPFAWQDARVMKIIREFYKGKKLTTAIAIYQTFTNLASGAGRKQRRHIREFQAPLRIIAEQSGKSVSTARRYIKEFGQLIILAWEYRKNGKMNQHNIWKLLDYPYHNNESTSYQDKASNPSSHNNEQGIKEGRRRYIINKGNLNNLKTHDGFQSIKDIIQ